MKNIALILCVVILNSCLTNEKKDIIKNETNLNNQFYSIYLNTLPKDFFINNRVKIRLIESEYFLKKYESSFKATLMEADLENLDFLEPINNFNLKSNENDSITTYLEFSSPFFVSKDSVLIFNSIRFEDKSEKEINSKNIDSLRKRFLGQKNYEKIINKIKNEKRANGSVGVIEFVFINNKWQFNKREVLEEF